jgi:hypothetical protein
MLKKNDFFKIYVKIGYYLLLYPSMNLAPFICSGRAKNNVLIFSANQFSYCEILQ